MWKKVVLFVVLGLSWGIPLLAQTSDDCQKCDCYHPTVPKSCEKCCGIMKYIKTLTEQLNQAVLKGDVATYDKLLANDYSAINILGGTSTKADVLEDYKSGRLKFEAIEVTDTKVRVYGDTALVNSTVNVKGHLGATDLSGQYRSVRVWVKRKGQWHSVSFQATRVAQQP